MVLNLVELKALTPIFLIPSGKSIFSSLLHPSNTLEPSSLTPEELIAVAKGISQAKAVAIKAALELGSRAAQMLGESRIILDAPQKVADMFMEEMRYFDKEHFRVVFLDTKCKMITWEDISIGTIFSIGRDAGVPHNAGNDEAQVEDTVALPYRE